MSSFKFQKLLVAVFLCNLMLVVWVSDAIAGETAPVTITITGASVCRLAEEYDPGTAWGALTPVTAIPIPVYGADLGAGYKEWHCSADEYGAPTGDYDCNLHWMSNAAWTSYVTVDSFSTPWVDEFGNDALSIKTGNGSTWHPLVLNSAYDWAANGPVRGVNDVDWKVDLDQGYDTPPGSDYTAVVTFTIENP